LRDLFPLIHLKNKNSCDRSNKLLWDDITMQSECVSSTQKKIVTVSFSAIQDNFFLLKCCG
jgi:hypothetical protein